VSLRDEDLARRILLRHSGAFEAFYDDFAPTLLGYLARMVGDRALAEDLLQDTVLRVHQRIGDYKEHGAFRAWVFRIATNLALTELRRRKLASAPEVRDRITFDAGRGARNPHESLEDAQRARIVEAGIAALPDEQRAALLLRIQDEMSVRDVARVLHVPEGTVKSRIHHAVRKLRAFVDGGGRSCTEESRDENV
jgi:RNA polymerase sigma-70 factor, ECF subfamily